MLTQGPSHFVQKLLQASDEERQTLIGETHYLRQFVIMLERFVVNADQLEFNEVSEQIENYPGIHELLNHPENVKQVILGMSLVTPLLYDLDQKAVTNEEVHANIKALSMYCLILEFLNHKIDTSHELAANLKISLMELYLKIAYSCEKFQGLGMLDPEYYECHLSTRTAAEHYQQALKIYTECGESLNQVPFSSKLWRFTIAKIKAHFGFCIISFQLRNHVDFELHAGELRQTINDAIKHSEKLAIEAQKDSKVLVKELLAFPFQLNEKAKALNQTESMIDLMFKELYNSIEQLNLNYGLVSTKEYKSIEASNSSKDILARIHQLLALLEQPNQPSEFIALFKDDLSFTHAAAKHLDDKNILGLITLFRLWFRVLLHNLSHTKTKYAELTLESLYLIRQGLCSHLSKTLPANYIDEMTDSLETYQAASQIDFGSADAVARWIEGPEKEKPAAKANVSKSDKKKQHPKLKKQVKPLINSTTENIEASKGSNPTTERVVEKAISNVPVTTTVKPVEKRAPVSKKKKNRKTKVKQLQSDPIKQPIASTSTVKVAATSSVVSSKEPPIPDTKVESSRHRKSELKYGEVSILKHDTMPKPSIISAAATSSQLSSSVENIDLVLNTQLKQLSLHDEKPLPVKIPIAYSASAFNTMHLILSQGKRVYAYGGAVRDTLFKKPYHDMDLVSDCDEATLLKLFPDAKKNLQIDVVNNYRLEAKLSITLVKDLNLALFSKDRYLAAEALLCDIEGQLFDPLNVYDKLCLENGQLAPVPGVDLIQSFTLDPSRIFRSIRTATHVQRAWSEEFHQAMVTVAPKMNQLPFGKFLYHFSEMFLRGKGALHFYICHEMGFTPHIALPMGSDSATYFNANSHLFAFIKASLMQIDHYPIQTVNAQNRLYLLALFLLPALEKMRLCHFKDNSKAYSQEELHESTAKMLEQFFTLYSGTIDLLDKTAKYKQLEAIINGQLWPSFLACRYRAMAHKAMIDSYRAPPQIFYMPVNVYPNDGVHAPFTSYVPYFQTQPAQQPFQQTSATHNHGIKKSPTLDRTYTL